MAIIRWEFDKEYFPDDGRKGKTLEEGLLCDCIYFCASNYWAVFGINVVKLYFCCFIP